MTPYKFEMKQVVKLVDSRETGTVIGRMEHLDMSPQYQVRYCAADGVQRECWWGESALEAA